jgi:hypothetical protein
MVRENIPLAMKTFYGFLMLVGVVMITFVACQVPTPAEKETVVLTESTPVTLVNNNTPLVLVEEQNNNESAVEDMLESHIERLERLERLIEQTAQSKSSIARISKVKR